MIESDVDMSPHMALGNLHGESKDPEKLIVFPRQGLTYAVVLFGWCA